MRGLIVNSMKRWWPILLALLIFGAVLFLAGYFLGKASIAIDAEKYDILRDVLAILIAILTIGIAAFGLGTYSLLKREVEQIAEERAERTTKEASTTTHQYIINELIWIGANLAYEKWMEWEGGMKKKEGQIPDNEYLLDLAISISREVLRFAEGILPPDKHKEFWTEQRSFFTILKNNLAYYLAERERVEDTNTARELAIEIEKEERSKSIPDYEHLETIAWVLKRFAISEADKERSQEIVAELSQRTDIPFARKKAILDRFKNAP